MITRTFRPATGQMRFASHAAFRGLESAWAQLTYLSWMQQPLQVSLTVQVRAGTLIPSVASARFSPLLRFSLLQQAGQYGGVAGAAAAISKAVQLLAQPFAAPFARPQEGAHAWWQVINRNVARHDVLHRLLEVLPQAFRPERSVSGREAFSSWPMHGEDEVRNPAFQHEAATRAIYSGLMLRMPSLAWMSENISSSAAAEAAVPPAALVLASMASSGSASESSLETWLKTLHERTDVRAERSLVTRVASLWSKTLQSMRGSTLAGRGAAGRWLMLHQHEVAHDDVRSRGARLFSSVGQQGIQHGVELRLGGAITPVTDTRAAGTSGSPHVPANSMHFVTAGGTNGSMRMFATENIAHMLPGASSAANTVFVYRASPPAAPSQVAIQRQIERIGQQVTRRVVHEMVPQAPTLEQMEQAVLAPRVVRELTRQVASMMAQRVSLERYRRGL